MSEDELYEYLKKMISDLKKTEDQYGVIDCTSEKFKMCVEMKCRDKDYDELMIEKSKYDSLMQCRRSRYICSTPSGIYSFNLKSVPEPLWIEIMLPCTTTKNKLKEYRLKMVGFLPIKLAKKIG